MRFNESHKTKHFEVLDEYGGELIEIHFTYLILGSKN